MELSNMNKLALRNACKARHISYGGMTNDDMRAALQAAVDAELAAVQAEQEAAFNAEQLELATQAAELEAQNNRIAAFLQGDRHLETSEGEYGFWTQTEDGPVWTRVDIASLGLYGLGGDEDTARCPHCGTNHMHNGYQTAESLSGDKVQHGLRAEYVCLGCNGEWGPAVVVAPKPASTKTVKAGTGLKIQVNRIERNGIKQPSIGGACRSVWDACTEMQALNPATPLKVKQVKDHAVTMGWNENNAVIEFYRWKKWAAPTLAEVQADADADAEASRAAVAPEAPAAEVEAPAEA